jgi:molybdenum cofactor synthesis domain-containing protein
MTEERIWTAALLIIGDEILSGRIQDRNVAPIATWLNVQGIRLAEVRVVADVHERIVAAVNALRAENDYLFTTGGIGPTHDDITVDAIAAATGVEVEVHPKARAALERHYETRGGITEARLRMARVPAGASLIENKMSGAPGHSPRQHLHPCRRTPHRRADARRAVGYDRGRQAAPVPHRGRLGAESEVAELLRETERAHDGVQIGSYPFFREGRVGANFVVRATEVAVLEACIEDLTARLEADGREVVDGGI